MAVWQPAPPAPDLLAVPDPPTRLARADDAVQAALEARRSERTFAPGHLGWDVVGRVLSGLSGVGSRRYVPSAGALYPLETFVLLRRVAGPLPRCAARYLPVEHALVPVADLPDDAALGRLLDPTGDPGCPMVVVFALRTAQMVAKYGERGGRFALIEVGAAAQNIGLRAAHEGLAGCLLGAVDESTLGDLLCAGRSPSVRVALAYALGKRPGG